MKSFGWLILFLISCGPAAAQEPVKITGPGDHQRLDFYRDESGAKKPVRTAADWEIRRRQIVTGFEKAAGPLSGRENLPELDVRIFDAVDAGSYTRQTIDFASEEGDRTPAYLYIPKGINPDEKRAGIVALHPTHKIGKGVVDGQSERPNRGYAKELAERGYVVIAPDYLSFGDYAGYDFAADRYKTGTMKGIWNHMRCVDVLAARDDVDPERIGNIGHSLGGHNAIFHGRLRQTSQSDRNELRLDPVSRLLRRQDQGLDQRPLHAEPP